MTLNIRQERAKIIYKHKSSKWNPPIRSEAYAEYVSQSLETTDPKLQNINDHNKTIMQKNKDKHQDTHRSKKKPYREGKRKQG